MTSADVAATKAPEGAQVNTGKSKSVDHSTRRQRSLQRFLILNARSVMTRNVVTITPNATLRELEQRHLLGFVTKFDFLKNFIFTPSSVVPHYDELVKRRVAEVMTSPVETAHPATPLTRVLQRMVETRDKSLPVVDEKNRLLGMISRGDIVRALRGR